MEANFSTICRESNDLTNRGHGKTHYIPILQPYIINPNVRFYSAELLIALEHLHELDVVYRYVYYQSICLNVTTCVVI